MSENDNVIPFPRLTPTPAPEEVDQAKGVLSLVAAGDQRRLTALIDALLNAQGAPALVEQTRQVARALTEAADRWTRSADMLEGAWRG